MAMTPHLEPGGTLTTEAPPGAPAGGLSSAKPRGLPRRGWGVFAENKMALVSIGFLIFVFLFCFVGPHIYKTEQVFVTLGDSLCHPSAQHLLGCDKLGYDILGRLMVGGQNSLEVGLAAAFVACLFG